jgi:hypothetical protein
MNFLCCFLCCFHPIIIVAQVSELKGMVTFNEEVLEGVTIKNISKNEYTISNESGFFAINSNVGDSLVFSFIGIQDFNKIVIAEDFQSEILNIRLFEKSIALEEVEVIEYASINAVSLRLIPEEMKDFTQYERRLANAGDFKPIHLLSLLGGSLEVDPILNAINGRTKRMKFAISLEKKQKNFEFLEINYTEFASEEMKLKEEEIGLFFTYLLENERLEKMVKNHQKDQFRFFLMEEWNRFQKNIVKNISKPNEKP